MGYYVSMWSEIRQASCLDSEMTQVSGLSLLGNLSVMTLVAVFYCCCSSFIVVKKLK